jgi:CheY-like chemotaxis protein
VSEEPIHILLVDDDDVDVMNVRRSFERGNISNELSVARDGIEALEMLRSDALPRSRRIVLLDLNMPRMNGIEMLRELRADPDLHSIPVVVLTTSNEERDRADAYRLHVAGYLVKPVTQVAFVELMVTLNRYWRLAEYA